MLTWNNLGLCFDIAGVLILAYALVCQSDKHLLAKTQTEFMGHNASQARDFCEQRADAAIGTVYLIIGIHSPALRIGAAAERPWRHPRRNSWDDCYLPLFFQSTR
jgi:hypothetical protein